MPPPAVVPGGETSAPAIDWLYRFRMTRGTGDRSEPGSQTRAGVRLWLDDLRPAPEGWLWVKTVEQAIDVLKQGQVTEASLDNDLGPEETEGRRLVLWMAEHEIWPSRRLQIHSANAVAVDYMSKMVDRYGPYKPSPSPTTFEA